MKMHLIRPLSLAALLACATAGLHAQGSAATGAGTTPGAAASAPSGSASGAAGSRSSAALKGNDRSFVTKAAVDGMYEVEAARLAEQKASDQSVKDLAATLVKQHTDANNELMQLASSKGVTLPTALPRPRQNELDKLSKLSGPAFDREFMRRIGIAAHQSDIKLFQNGSRSAKDPQLKAWIDKTLPTLREHLAQAQKIPMPAAGSTSSRGTGASGTGTTGTGASSGTSPSGTSGSGAASTSGR